MTFDARPDGGQSTDLAAAQLGSSASSPSSPSSPSPARAGRSARSKQDMSLAVAAGPGHWLGTGNEITTPILATAIVHFIAIGGLASRITHDWIEFRDPPAIGYATVVVATWLSAISLSAPVVVRLLSSFRRSGRSLARALTLRLIGVVGIAVTMGPVVHGWDAVSFWPIIAFVASDLGLTLIALERLPTRPPPLSRVMRSPWNLVSALAAGVVVGVLTGRIVFGVVAFVLVEVQVAAVYGGLTLVCRLTVRYEFELERARRAALEIGHRDRAHWIHDDVLSELRLTRLRIERAGAHHGGASDGDGISADAGLLSGPTELVDVVTGELDELEHRLRVRQLDEMVRTGDATIAQLLQPYLRLATGAGVHLTVVPTYEVGKWQVGEATAALVKRAFAVPITNALLAHTRSLEVRVSTLDGFLVVDVIDDAGGFEPLDEHRGRGLSTLDTDLAPGGVQIVRLEAGTQVVSRVPLSRHDTPLR